MANSISHLHSQCDLLMRGRTHRNHHSTPKNEGGKFFEPFAKYPVILHDDNGCLEISTNEHLQRLIKEGIFNAAKKVNCPKGISKVYGYKKCDFGPKLCPKHKSRTS